MVKKGNNRFMTQGYKKLKFEPLEVPLPIIYFNFFFLPDT